MTRERFIELVSAEQEQLRRFLCALCCGDVEKAEDLAQETLIKAYLASDSYVERFKFSTWLFKIAYNTFLDRVRAHKPGPEPLEVAGNIESEARTDDAFRYQTLYDALDTLSLKERTVVLLFYFKGYSVKEISQITDSSRDAVKKQLSRARERLRIIIGDEGRR